MMLLSMKTYVALLWAICVLFIPKTYSSNSTTEATRQLVTSHVLHNDTRNSTHKPTELSVVTPTTAISPTVESQKGNMSSKTNRSDVSNAGLVVVSTVAVTPSSAAPQLLHTPTTADEIQPSHNTIMSETVKPTKAQQSSTTPSEMTAPATTFAEVSTTSVTTPALSSLQPLSITKPEVTASSTSSDNLTQAPHLTQNLSSSPPSTTTIMTTILTSEAAPVFDPTSLPATISVSVTSSTEVSTISQPISDTQTNISASQFPDTLGTHSTTESPTALVSTDSTLSTTAFSTSAAGILVPHVPKMLPVSTTKSLTTNAAAPREVPKSPATNEVQPCSTRAVANHCLLIIASLSVLATIFIISTIILCTKLSARKYKVKKRQQGTEMMCISALLPERNYTYTRQRNPVSNGILVIPTGGDSDEDGGDNLTLSSFLPDNDRIV